MTLEQEFEEYKSLHKYCILKKRLIEIFQNKEINIPSFNNDEIEARVEFLMCEVARIGKYDELYELAWNETKDNFY